MVATSWDNRMSQGPLGSMTDERTASVHLQIFAAEAEVYLEDLRAQLDALGEGIDTATGSRLLKPAHALKGTARMLGFDAIADLCHQFEEVATSIRSGPAPQHAGPLETLRQSIDVLEGMVSSALAGGTVSPNVEMARRLSQITAASEEQPSSMGARLDAIARGQSPMPGKISRFSPPAARARSGPLVARLERIAQPMDETSNWLAVAPPSCSTIPRSISVPASDLDSLLALLKRLRNKERAVAAKVEELSKLRGLIEKCGSAEERGVSAGRGQPLTETLPLVDRCLEQTRATHKALEDVERRVHELRYCRVDVVFSHLGEAIRTQSQHKGKRARCILRGGHLEVERELVSGLSGPITHLIGNAIHHGLEDPHVRREHGKPAEGRISLSWEKARRGWRIEVADDGAGIDTERVRQNARRHRLYADDVLESMDDEQIAQLIFVDGITTSPTLSIAGGRGIGLTVVKTGVEKLGGRVSVATRAGFGTTFTIDIPRPRLLRRATPSKC